MKRILALTGAALIVAVSGCSSIQSIAPEDIDSAEVLSNTANCELFPESTVTEAAFTSTDCLWEEHFWGTLVQSEEDNQFQSLIDFVGPEGMTGYVIVNPRWTIVADDTDAVRLAAENLGMEAVYPDPVEEDEPEEETEPEPTPEPSPEEDSEPSPDPESEGTGFNDPKDPYLYPDGLKVEIEKKAHGVLTAEECEYMCDSAKAGDDWVILTFKATNGTDSLIEAYGYASLSYGPESVDAEIVYPDGMAENDMSGKILPGKSKKHTMAFAVPAEHQDDVLISFTADFEHDGAVWYGSVAE